MTEPTESRLARYGHFWLALVPLAGAAVAAACNGPGNAESWNADGGSPPSSSSGSPAADSGSGAATPLSQNAADLHLADPDPTTAACVSGGELLVPFRVMTRLNRVEYDNTVRDLLGDANHVALNGLPPDYGDGGFDNNADALTIDPLLPQTYLQVAEALAEQAVAPNSPGRARIYVCTTTDDACAGQIASSFAARAWRRPVTSAEVANLLKIYTDTRASSFSFDQGIQILVEGALMSPNFLFRPEIDPTPDSPSQHPVNPYELASRLSYFLWSTMPDATLTSVAASGELSTHAGVAKQAARMWADPKAAAFVARFPGQWLGVQNITPDTTPDPTVFPQFSAAVQSAMQAETANYMRDFVTGDRNFLDFVNGTYTYINSTLAQFYGIAGTYGSNLTRVDLTGNAQRGGILTQGSFLTVTSPGTRTSPVKRGQWVLARLLATNVPPPPPDVPPITAAVPSDKMTFRQKLDAHANNPACSGCHYLMDPIGYGLENYDGVGEWRTIDNGLPVDSSGALPGGQMFNGAKDLEALLRQSASLPNAVVQYLLSYALGRSITSTSDTWAADECAVGAFATAFQSTDQGRMSAFVARVEGSDAMRLRRAAR